MNPTALLLIAHGSRRPEANADLEELAQRLRRDYVIVQPSYLELADPNIVQGGTMCVEAGARQVILLPYFLSAGMHVTEDLTAARDELARKHADVQFLLAKPLGLHPLMVEVVKARAREVVEGRE
jgi:sirohydrochlorin ferrochelatase